MPANLKPLTSLRFFAALWVVLYHYWPGLGLERPALIGKGYLGVELFFVLSGFILSHVYIEDFGAGRFKWRGFIRARIARVYPLHLATLAAVAGMGVLAVLMRHPVDPNVLALRALPANLLMIHAWGFTDVAAWNHPSWSISAEWFAYLSFPAFAWAAWRLRARPGLAMLAALALLFGLYAGFRRLAGFPLTEATFAWGALRIVPCFAYGCAMWLAFRAGAAARPGAAGALALVSAAAALALAWAGADDAVTVALFGLLILGLAGMSDAPGVLGAPGLVWLGEVSYAAYLVCIPWKMLFPKVAQGALGADPNHMPLLVWLIFLVALVPLSGLAHHAIERPARNALRTLDLGRKGARIAAAAT